MTSVTQLLASNPGADLIADDKLPGLAWALAAGVKSPEMVLTEYGLDLGDHAVMVLLDSERFTRLYMQACEDLKQEGDGQDRVRRRARRAVEATIPDMERAVTSQAPLSERVSAFRSLAKVAGLEDPPPQAGNGERFVINISVPAAGGATVSVVSADMSTAEVVGSPGRENSGPVIEGTVIEAEPAVEPELAGEAALAYLDRDIFGNPLPR